MAKFSETLIRYSPLIGQILGNIDDIRVTRNYNEARKEIENAEKRRQEYQKFLTYNQKLRSIDPSDKDFYNTKEVLDPNITGNEDDFYQNTLIGQDYLNRKNLYTETDETGKKYRTDETGNKMYLDQDPLYSQDINKILETNPKYVEDLRQKGFYKTLYEPKDEKEINTLRYTKAGIPEEEAKWYEQYSQTFNPQDYNLQLQRMVLDKYPDLVSSGEYGSKYFDLFGKQMSTMGITAPEYKFSANKDYLLKYDDTGNYEIIPIKNPNAGDEQKKQFTKHVNDQKNWYAKQDYKGDWHYYTNYYDGESGTFKEMKMRRMSDEELEKKEREAYKEELGIEKTKLQILKLQGLLPGSNGSGKSGNRSGNRSGDGSETGDGSVSMKYSMLDKQTRDDFNKYLTTLHDYNRLPPHKKTQEQIDDIKEMRNSLVDRYTEKEVRDMENAFFNENVTEPEFKKKVTNINRELQRNNISIKIDDENFDIDNPQDIAVLEEEMAKKIKSYTPEQIEELQKNLDNQPLRVRKLVRDIYQKYSPKR